MRGSCLSEADALKLKDMPVLSHIAATFVVVGDDKGRSGLVSQFPKEKKNAALDMDFVSVLCRGMLG